MEALALALIIIFCHPFGWMGLFVFGITICMFREAKKGK